MKALWKSRHRILALFIAVAMLIPTAALSSCGTKDSKTDWSISATDNIVSLDVAMAGDDTSRTLEVTASEDIFAKKIKNEQIQIIAYDLDKSESETTASESKSDELTDFSIVRDDAKKLTITLASGADSAHWGYTVAVHKSATTSGAFGEGWVFTPTTEEIYNYSAALKGTYTTAQSNPVLVVELTDTVVATGFSKEMVTLGGVFGTLKIVSASGNGSTVTIVTEGTMDTGFSGICGTVALSDKATSCGQELNASADVAYVGAYVADSSFAFAGGTLKFTIQLAGNTFKANVGDTIASDGITVKIETISEDRTSATVSVSVSADGIDSAIAAVDGKTITIPADMLENGSSERIAVSAFKASVGMTVDYVEVASVGTYKGTGVLFAENGRFAELAASDLVFTGDFSDAVVTDIAKESDTTYNVTFILKACELNLEDAHLSGSVTVADGKLLNDWGSASGSLSSDISYDTGLDKEESTWESIMKFVADHKDTLDNLSTVTSVIGGVGSAVSGVYTILQLCGVIESTDDKLDSIRDEIRMAQAMMRNISSQITKQTALMESEFSRVHTSNDTSLYLSYTNAYSTFVKTYVTPLNNAVSSYRSAYNAYMLSYIGSADKQTVTVYRNDKGEITYPGNMAGYDIEGNKIVSATEYRLEKGLSRVIEKVAANGGRIYDEYLDDIEEIVDKNYKPDTSLPTFEELQKKGLADYENAKSIISEMTGVPEEFPVYSKGNEGNPYSYNDILWFIKNIPDAITTTRLWDMYFSASRANLAKVAKLRQALLNSTYVYEDDHNAMLQHGIVEATGYRVEKELLDHIGIVDANGNEADLSAADFMTALKTQAAIAALSSGTVSSMEIINAYVNFAHALSGSEAGAPRLASVKTPLDNFYLLESYFYNFYSEAESDIKAITAWLASVNIEGKSLAALAYAFTPSAEKNVVSDSAQLASVELLRKDRSHSVTDAGKQFSFVKNSVIHTQKMHIRSNGICLEGENIPGHVSSYISASEFLVMLNRYTNMKNLGIVSDATFADYLVSRGLITSDMKDGRILIGDWTESSLPLDCSVSLRCCTVAFGKWFKVGNSYPMGTYGKYQSKYFYGNKLFKVENYSLDGTRQEASVYKSNAYFELFFFVDSEGAGFLDRIYCPMFYFVTG